MEQRDEMNDWLREILGDVFKEDAKNIAREYEQKGMEKGMEIVALNMISMDMDTSTICRATGLNSETVEKLRKK